MNKILNDDIPLLTVIKHEEYERLKKMEREAEVQRQRAESAERARKYWWEIVAGRDRELSELREKLAEKRVWARGLEVELARVREESKRLKEQNVTLQGDVFFHPRKVWWNGRLAEVSEHLNSLSRRAEKAERDRQFWFNEYKAIERSLENIQARMERPCAAQIINGIVSLRDRHETGEETTFQKLLDVMAEARFTTDSIFSTQYSSLCEDAKYHWRRIMARMFCALKPEASDAAQ